MRNTRPDAITLLIAILSTMLSGPRSVRSDETMSRAWTLYNASLAHGEVVSRSCTVYNLAVFHEAVSRSWTVFRPGIAARHLFYNNS